MRFFTSDLHFFHQLVFKKYRNNFNTIEEMHESIVKKWNRTVRKKDLVFVLGDVTFGKLDETKAIISRLNGRKILIRGNHDERFTSAQWIEMGFEDVRDTFVIKKENEKWILCHFPFSSSFKYFYHKKILKKNEANYFKLYPTYKSYKLIHGHHHTGEVYNFDRLNVAWDLHQRLLDENELQSLFSNNKETDFARFWKTFLACFW